MYRLIRDNVERIAATEEQRDSLLGEGFKLIKEKKAVRAKKDGGEDNGEDGAGTEA